MSTLFFGIFKTLLLFGKEEAGVVPGIGPKAALKLGFYELSCFTIILYYFLMGLLTKLI
jgi:hypothetical protein